jgi:predicted O-methyltransferase YrrM
VFHESIRAYAQRHGYGYHFHDDFDPARPPAWSKIRFLREHLKGYEVLVWVDADVYAGPNAGSVDQLLIPPTPVVISADRNGLNSGVFAIQSGPWSESFLAWVWEQTQYLHHRWWEQAAIQARYRAEPEAFRIAPKRVLNAYPDEVGPETVFVHFPSRWRAETDWFAAYAAQPDAVGDTVDHLVRVPPSVTRIDDAHAILLAGLVTAHKPDRVLEIGCGWGTTLTIARALTFNRTGFLTVVDNWRDYGGAAHRPPVENWVRPCDRVVTADEGEFLAAQPEGSIDFLLVDANHAASDRYVPLVLRAVRVGGVMCWHDTANPRFPNLGRILGDIDQRDLDRFHFTRATRPGERTGRGFLVAIR